MGQEKKKIKHPGCLIVLVEFIAIVVFTIVEAKRMFLDDYKKFDDKRIAEIERRLEFTMPEGVTPVHYIRRTGAGDSVFFLQVEGINSPEEYMAEAYKNVSYKQADMAVYDNSSEWFEFDGDNIWKTDLEYDKQLTRPDEIYVCEYEKPEGGRYLMEYVLAFYKDGDSWKMKLYAIHAV